MDIARVNFQKAVKIVYVINDEQKIKPVIEHQEYDVGEKPKLDLQVEDDISKD